MTGSGEAPASAVPVDRFSQQNQGFIVDIGFLFGASGGALGGDTAAGASVEGVLAGGASAGAYGGLLCVALIAQGLILLHIARRLDDRSLLPAFSWFALFLFVAALGTVSSRGGAQSIGWIEALTLVLAIGTVIFLWSIVPKLANLPTRKALLREISTRRAAERRLAQMNLSLEERVRQRTQEQERSERELLSSRERLETALLASGTGTFRWDVAQGVFEWDEQLARVLRLEQRADAREPAGLLASVHPADRKRVRRAHRRCALRGGEIDLTFRIVGEGGETRWIEEKARAFCDAAGRTAYVTGACVDVTARTRSEESLRASEQQLQQLADSMPQIVWTASADGEVDYFNRRWYELIDPGSEGLGGLQQMLHPDDREEFVRRWQHALLAGEAWEMECRLRISKTGEYRWQLIRALPVLAEPEHGLQSALSSAEATTSVAKWYGTCTDIHSLKQAEELRELLLAELSHRVKNTLATVQSLCVQTLAHAPSPAEFQVAFQGRLKALSEVHRLLTKSKWEGAPVREVALRELKPHLPHRDALVRLEGPELLLRPKAALAIQMVIHELTTNAAKYGSLRVPEGGVLFQWEEQPDAISFIWRESGGPLVSPPQRSGFGTRAISAFIEYELQGRVMLEYHPLGLICRFTVPMTGNILRTNETQEALIARAAARTLTAKVAA